jgi:hypothetical protein
MEPLDQLIWFPKMVNRMTPVYALPPVVTTHPTLRLYHLKVTGQRSRRHFEKHPISDRCLTEARDSLSMTTSRK